MARWLLLASVSICVCLHTPDALCDPADAAGDRGETQEPSDAAPAQGQPADALAPLPDHFRELEWKLLPVAAGSTDIGVLLGTLGILAGHRPGCSPYCWRTTLQISKSFKNGPDGLESPVALHFIKLDLKDVVDGLPRLLPALFYQRTINAGYYGLGNGSPETTTSRIDDDPDAASGRYYQYERTEARLQLTARFDLPEPFFARVGLRLQYLDLSTYSGSLLAADIAADEQGGTTAIYGTSLHVTGQVAAGLDYDTRDDEITPSRGMYHDTSVRVSPGLVLGKELRFVGVTLNLRHYQPLIGEYLVLASRIYADALFGHVPFYELSRGGAFPQVLMPGGARGIRGVPEGRFHAPIKVLGTLELRAMRRPSVFLRQRMRWGFAFFVDTGRVWSTGPEAATLNGTGLGLTTGFGLGPRILWGRTMLLRFDFAYSEAARDLNPDLPIGIYLDLNQAF